MLSDLVHYHTLQFARNFTILGWVFLFVNHTTLIHQCAIIAAALKHPYR